MKGIDLQAAGASAAQALADAQKEAQPLVVKYALGDEPKLIGRLNVSAVGVQYFEKNQLVSVAAEGPITLEMLVDKLIANTKRFTPAYWVTLPCGTRVGLSQYWTEKVADGAPELKAGDAVDVFGIKNPKTGHAAFVYRKATK
jgi:hypothetical protein